MSDFYQLQATSLQQQNINMKDYQGKVVLIVNTASKCGLTPQYEGLQKLYDKYKDQGLVILGFPCNQFRQQEPGDANQISEGCLINYGVDFQMFEKIDVNGANSHPIYQYLKSALPGIFGNNIKWNFTKFLIGSDGTPIKRFAPTTKPAAIEEHIQQALAK
ncbi:MULTISPECIES: glutathione peroxidase [unclassified Pseudoalteromonas]|uniref:glutathione peroxidase n=1 Tax=unclassified Pseudoalteromonas TaxID=194690 RepID=UPI0005A9C2A1|nr:MULTISPECIES: glutathione peroxidase [unclassified Pseudoalteromonas]